MSQELSGTWEYRVLTRTSYTGHRVKRMTSATPHIEFSGPLAPDFPGGSTWTREAQPTIAYQGDTYVFGFWSITGQNVDNGNPYSTISSDRHANVTLGPPGTWLLTARAWYYWDFGSGPGNNGVYVDAFDITAGDFLYPDFVDVTPDSTGQLTSKTNNDGFLDTNVDVTQEETIKARNFLTDWPGYFFSNWQTINALTWSPPGAPEPDTRGNDLVVHPSDRIVAIALYNQVPHEPRILPRVRAVEGIIVIQPGGDTGPVPAPIGNPPVGPGPGPFGELFASANLLDKARFVSGKSRTELLRSAEKMALAAASSIKKDLERKE